MHGVGQRASQIVLGNTVDLDAQDHLVGWSGPWARVDLDDLDMIHRGGSMIRPVVLGKRPAVGMGRSRRTWAGSGGPARDHRCAKPVHHEITSGRSTIRPRS